MDNSVRVLKKKKKHIHSVKMEMFQIVSFIVILPLANPVVKQICFAKGSCQPISTYIYNQATFCNTQISDLLDLISSWKPSMSNPNKTYL